MYIPSRAAQVRNMSIAAVNGAITLIILLIAPLGLAAVIINTALVAIATYFTATVADRVVRYLIPEAQRAELLGMGDRSSIQRQSESNQSDRLP